MIARLHANDAGPNGTIDVADKSGTTHHWISLLLATAAGFLLALVLFPPWKRPGIEGPPVVAVPPVITVPPPAVAQPVATLVAATGDVQVLPPGATVWQTDAYVEQFMCPSDATVRTGPNVRCEWKTADGSVVRLNGDTQVRFASPGVVEVQRGQIACSSPENGSLKVIVPERTGAAATPTPLNAVPMEFMCRPQSSALAAVEPGGDVRVTSSAGDVAWQSPQGAAPLERGESVRFVDGQIVREGSVDPLLAASWTGALLVRKGHDDPELAERVDQLLARMGQSKVTLLYEQEIRALGEHAVLPLLKFVESPLSQNARGQRHEAMRIASDLAPAWAIADLLRLLSDADAATRVLSAQALRRLTGQDQGREPSQWRDDLKTCEPTIELWRQWWQAEQNRYPPRKPDRET